MNQPTPRQGAIDLEDLCRWLGYRVDDTYGGRIGVLRAFYCEAESPAPVWMLVRAARASETYRLVPPHGMACGNGRLWIPFTREKVMQSGPVAVDRPVRPAFEARLCRHYGITPTRGARLAHGERRSALFALGPPTDTGSRHAAATSRSRGWDGVMRRRTDPVEPGGCATSRRRDAWPTAPRRRERTRRSHGVRRQIVWPKRPGGKPTVPEPTGVAQDTHGGCSRRRA